MDDDVIRGRLGELREQRASGQSVLLRLQAKQRELEATLLRIDGAIQVLEELLAGQQQSAKGAGLAVSAQDLDDADGS